MIDLGHVKPGSTVRIPFSTFAKADGTSITMTNFVALDILVYKDGSTTERASTSGFTATTDFDSKTGKQLITIDLSDNTTAGFWNAGSEYLVAVDSVTVDGGATGGWVARFKIGYSNAILNTTVATLSSQTSFTLTSGPAEDNALVGYWAIVHNIASAVQQARVIITAYTGSTKTVTLAAGATFTLAAGDNISVMQPIPLQGTTLGNTLDVNSNGEAGIDWGNIGNKTTSNAFTGTTIATTQQVDVNTIKTQSVTCSGGVTIPAATLASTTNITAGTITTTTNLTNLPSIPTDWLTAAGLATDAVQEIRNAVTGGAYALSTDANGRIRIVDGTGTGEIDTNAGAISLVTTVTTLTNDPTGVTTLLSRLTSTRAANLDNLDATVSGVPASIWDLTTTGHTTSGTFGAAMVAAGSAGDPWSTSLPGSYGAGTAGYILGTYLDAAITGRATNAGVWANGTRTLTALGFVLGAADIGTDAIDADALATDAVNEIRNAVTGGDYALSTDANGMIRIVDGTGTGEIDTTSGGVLVGAYASGKAPLQSTVSGRTLDVSATGEAGIDWANVGTPTSIVNLSSTVLGSVSNLGNNSISNGSFTTAAISSTKFASGAINSTVLAASCIGASQIAADAIGASELASDAITEIVNGVWDELQSNHSTTGTFGKYLDIAVSSRLAATDYTAPDNADITTILSRIGSPATTLAGDIAALNDISAVDVWASATRTLTGDTTNVLAIKAKTDNLPSNPAASTDIPSVSQIFGTALAESYRSTGSTGTAAQLIYELIGHMGNSAISGTDKTIKKLDQTTTAKTFLMDNSANPTSIRENT